MFWKQASPKTGYKSQNIVCYNSIHIMEKVQSVISVMALLGRNYNTNHSDQRKDCGGEINLQ